MARLIAAAFILAVWLAGPVAAKPAPGDRWVEFELYWFDPASPERSARVFWDRYTPLFSEVEGHRGIVLSVGLTVDFIMDWSGDPAQQLWLPRGTGQELGAPITGSLVGGTAERQEAWRRRFADHDKTKIAVVPNPWTYRQLGLLTTALKREGDRRGIKNFKVAALATAHINAYGETGPFATAHREAWTRWGTSADPVLDTRAYFDPMAKLAADARPRAGLPRGITAALPVHEAFGAQWGAASRDLGFDALMLRDSFGFPRAYTRYGPFGESLPTAGHAKAMTDGVLAMLASLKRGNPQALTMMYSSAATASADWIANGLDLETVAKSGNLDIFVDQSWAGAWGEVGVRRQTFWNAPILGWTYQLQYFLQHAAVLAGTKVRHYPLVDTFDAWESWDTIHTAPDRLRWAIWAYSHAAVKTPRGLEVADGQYISWGHHGGRLLEADDIAFLAREIGEAARDAAAMTDVHGPTLVYSRDQVAAEIAGLPLKTEIRDRLDEQVGTVAKWSVPVLSITRLEWLRDIRADSLLFGRTQMLGSAALDVIVERARAGQPMAFFASFGGGLHPELAKLGGIRAAAIPSRQDRRLTATVGMMPSKVTNVPSSFETLPPTSGVTADGARAVYSFGGSPALIRVTRPPFDLVFWDPVPIADFWYRPMQDLLNGDRAPFVLAAGELNAQLARRGARLPPIDADMPASYLAWSRAKQRRELFADLEEGLGRR